MVAGKDTGTNWKEAGYVEKRRTLSRNGCSYNARGSTAAISGSNLKLLCSGRAPSVLHVGRHCELLGLIGGELELNQLALAVLRCTRAKPKGRVDMRVTGSGWSQRLSISIKDGGNDKCHASCKADKAHEHRCTRRRRPGLVTNLAEFPCCFRERALNHLSNKLVAQCVIQGIVTEQRVSATCVVVQANAPSAREPVTAASASIARSRASVRSARAPAGRKVNHVK